MKKNAELLRKIEDKTKPSFVETDIWRAHKGIAKAFKFKARNENAIIWNQQYIVCVIHYIT